MKTKKIIPNPAYQTARYKAALVPVESMAKLLEGATIDEVPSIPFPFLPPRFNKLPDGKFELVLSHTFEEIEE